MATPVLIIGKSGSGKSRSMIKCVGNPDWRLIRVINKPLPFKGKIDGWTTDNYEDIKKILERLKAPNVVIDDAGYLLTNMFMRGHSTQGAGNNIYSFYNKVGDSFWGLIQFVINNMPADKIVFVIMHEEQTELGEVKPKTIGRMLDEKVCVEGMFTIALRCVAEGGKHLFVTQASDGAISKSPEGMFETLTIDNNLLLVEKAIRDYYKED
jgi:hypothetical protein